MKNGRTLFPYYKYTTFSLDFQISALKETVKNYTIVIADRTIVIAELIGNLSIKLIRHCVYRLPVEPAMTSVSL